MKKTTHLNNGGKPQPVDLDTQQFKSQEDDDEFDFEEDEDLEEYMSKSSGHDDYLYAYDSAKNYDLFFKLPPQYQKQLRDRALEILERKTSVTGREAYDIFNCFDHYLNNMWSNLSGSLSREDQRQMKIIDDTIDKLPKFKGTIHRGLHFRMGHRPSMVGMKNLLNQINNSINNGEPFNLMGFPSPISFSSNIDVAHKFAKSDERGYSQIIFSIKNNKSGASVRFMSMYELEDEVLHKSTQKYKALTCNQKKNSKTGGEMFFVEIEEIDD